MDIPIRCKGSGYAVTVERGVLAVARTRFDLNRKVLIVTDDGVPSAYAAAIAAAAKTPIIETVPAGESSKSHAVFERLQKRMLQEGFFRTDCVVAVGGGVVSDLAGFCAATYMRGIDFYAVPTTVLSAVDASVGGKTGLNLCGVKNVVGAFYRPRGVLIDPDTFRTLPRRQAANGLAEAVKMAVTMDAALFERFEADDPIPLDEVVVRAVTLKRDIVERDEHEQNERRVLNFGHTIGHGIESAADGALYHGECVAIGMLPMCADAVRERLAAVLQRLGLPTKAALDPEAVYAALLHDKKAAAGGVTVVRTDRIGTYRMETVEPKTLRPLIDTVIREEAE